MTTVPDLLPPGAEVPVGLLGPVALAAGLVGLDVVSVPQAMISRPIVGAVVGGALLGEPLAGLVCGVALECLALESLPVAEVLDAAVAAVIPVPMPAGSWWRQLNYLLRVPRKRACGWRSSHSIASPRPDAVS